MSLTRAKEYLKKFKYYKIYCINSINHTHSFVCRKMSNMKNAPKIVLDKQNTLKP